MKKELAVIVCLIWVLPAGAVVDPIDVIDPLPPIVDLPEIIYVPDIVDIPEIIDFPGIIDIPDFITFPDFIDFPDFTDFPDIVDVPLIPEVPRIVDIPRIEPITIIDPIEFVDVVATVEPIRIITVPDPVIAAPVEIINVPDIPDIDIPDAIDLTLYSRVHIYRVPDIPEPVDVSRLVVDAHLTGQVVDIATADLIEYTETVKPFRIITLPSLSEPIQTVDQIEVTEIVDTRQIDEILELLEAVDRVMSIIDTADHIGDLIGLLGYPFEPIYHPDPVHLVEWPYRVVIIDIVDPPILVEWPHVLAAADLSLPLYVDASEGSDQGTSQAFATIQKAIDAAVDGDVIRVMPGVYREAIDFRGKAIAVQSAGDAAVLEAPDDFAVSFCAGEGPQSIFRNFVIRDSLVGVFVGHGSPTITNVTVVKNEYGIECSRQAEPHVSNCILWDNAESDLYGCQAVYSCIEREAPGAGNLSEDPRFVDADGGDYHLLSQRGRYWPTHDVWVLDDETSPCVDAGDPTADFSLERTPNGGRRNIGAYGGSGYASMSEARDSN